MRGSDYAELRAFVTVVSHGNFARAGRRTQNFSIDTQSDDPGVGNAARCALVESDDAQRLLDQCRRAPSRALQAGYGRDGSSGSGCRQSARHTGGNTSVHMSRTPAATYLEPILGRFHEAYPDIILDVTIDEAVTDIVEAGYDVGIRLGEFLEADLVAVKLGGEQRQLAVASPDYITRHGQPETPADLLHHHCINWRQQAAPAATSGSS